MRSERFDLVLTPEVLAQELVDDYYLETLEANQAEPEARAELEAMLASLEASDV